MTQETLSSLFEIEVTPGGIVVFERSGDGRTAVLVAFLERMGLKLRVKTDSPCG